MTYAIQPNRLAFYECVTGRHTQVAGGKPLYREFIGVNHN
jgi:hypothetical protein